MDATETDLSLTTEHISSARGSRSAEIVQFSLEMDESASDAKFLLVDSTAFDTIETYDVARRAARKTIKKGNSVALALFHVEKLGAEINSFIREYTSVLILTKEAAQTLTNANDPLSAAMVYRNMHKAGAILCDSKGGYMFDNTSIYGTPNKTVLKTSLAVPLSVESIETFVTGLLYGLTLGEKIDVAAQTGFSYRSS